MYHHCPPKHRPCREKFKIECVIVCREYSDFLRHTLPNNKHLFDRVVVVTSPEDKNTQKVCEFYHVECVQTDVISKEFCKGRAINKGLEKLTKDGWVLHLDADIWLPPQTRILLENACLDRHMLYGIDRFNVHGYRGWAKFLKRPILQHECGSYIHLNNSFPVATRVMQPQMNGYIPIGFFQMWCPSVSGVYSYPEGHTDAGREDLLFAKQWPRRDRGFIPEVIGYHLESEDAGFGTNWSGRKTKLFEPEPWWKRWFWNLGR